MPPSVICAARLPKGCEISLHLVFTPGSIKKTWSQSCCPFHEVKALALPSQSKRATQKAPRRMYIGTAVTSSVLTGHTAIWTHFRLSINTPRGVPVALFLTDCLNLRDSYFVKTKALQKTPMSMMSFHLSQDMPPLNGEHQSL